VRDADAGHQDRPPTDGGLIDHDRDPPLRMGPEREAHEQRRHDGAIQCPVAQQPIEPFGSHFLGLVERQRPRERTERESAVATARAPPELEHRDGEEREP
jgi:hypothetical protein